MTTLEQLKADIDREIASNPNTAVKDVLNFVKRLAAEVGPGVPMEGDALRAQNIKLIADLASLNSLLDNDANVFRAIKAAFGEPDMAMGELPGHTDQIMVELRALRGEVAGLRVKAAK